MENPVTFLYDVFILNKIHKNTKYKYLLEGDKDYFLKLYPEMAQMLMDLRFEKDDDRVFVRLINIKIDHHYKTIEYVFDNNVISSEIPESDYQNFSLQDDISEYLKLFPFRLKKAMFKYLKNNSYDMDHLIHNVAYGKFTDIKLTKYLEYTSIVTFKINDTDYTYNGNLIFTSTGTVQSHNYDERAFRRVYKVRFNFNDSTVNKNLILNQLVDSIKNDSIKKVKDIKNKYIEGPELLLNLFYNNFTEYEDKPIMDLIKNDIPEELFDMIKDVNINDVLEYDINIGE